MGRAYGLMSLWVALTSKVRRRVQSSRLRLGRGELERNGTEEIHT